MQPSGYFRSPHLALGAIWVWDSGLRKGDKRLNRANFVIRNRFRVTLRIRSPEICKQYLQVKHWQAEARAKKADKLKSKSNKLEQNLGQVQAE